MDVREITRVECLKTFFGFASMITTGSMKVLSDTYNHTLKRQRPLMRLQNSPGENSQVRGEGMLDGKIEVNP